MRFLMLVVFFLSVNACATQPGDEDMEGSRFCGYQKIKDRIPSACPMVDEILTNVSIYENKQMSHQYTTLLNEKIIKALSESKRHPTIIGRAISDSRIIDGRYFDQESRIQGLKDNQFLIKINIRIIDNGDNDVFILVNNFIGINFLIYSYSKVIPTDGKNIDGVIEKILDETFNEVKNDLFVK